MNVAMVVKIVATILLIAAVFTAIHFAKAKKHDYNLADVNFGASWTYQPKDFEVLKSDERAHFVSPVLFPLDLLLLLSLGGAIAMASLTLAGPARIPSEYRWLLFVMPLAYMVSDLTENCLFTYMLLSGQPSAVSDTIGFARAFTALKLLFVGDGFLQVLGLAGASVYFAISS